MNTFAEREDYLIRRICATNRAEPALRVASKRIRKVPIIGKKMSSRYKEGAEELKRERREMENQVILLRGAFYRYFPS